MPKSVSSIRLTIYFAVFLSSLVLISQAAVASDLERLGVGTKNGRRDFLVEVVDTPKAREIGLMYRKNLPAKQGMLFVYPREQRIRFWMRNTPISLDMIFFSADGIVRYIFHDAEPYSLTSVGPEVPVRFVLEINGGLSKQHGIQVGDRVDHDLIEKNP